MSKRGTALVVLVCCVIGGLVAAIFTPVIAATLMLPNQSGTRALVTATAAATAGKQPTMPSVIAAATAPGGTTIAPTAQPTMPPNVTVLARDDFQRTDQAGWGMTSDHRPWQSDARSNPAFTIANQSGHIVAPALGTFQATLQVPYRDAEVLVQGSVSRFDAQGITNLGAVLRWKDTNNWYKALIDGQTIQLLKDVNGQISVLATHPLVASPGAVYSLRFRVQGGNLFARAWAVAQPEPANWIVMATDDQLATGISGIRVKEVAGVLIVIHSFLETSVPNTL